MGDGCGDRWGSLDPPSSSPMLSDHRDAAVHVRLLCKSRSRATGLDCQRRADRLRGILRVLAVDVTHAARAVEDEDEVDGHLGRSPQRPLQAAATWVPVEPLSMPSTGAKR